MGLTLLIISLITFPFEVNKYILGLIFLSAFLSSIPDVDLKLGIAHRASTHSFLFAILAGITYSIIFGFIIKDLYWYIIGFFAGFGAVILHLIGDLMTYMAFKPFYPFSSKEVSLGWFRADNLIVNYGLFILGGTVFIFYLFKHIKILHFLI